jgi:hypothetical protein
MLPPDWKMFEFPNLCDPVNSGTKLGVPLPSISSSDVVPDVCAKAVETTNTATIKIPTCFACIDSPLQTRFFGTACSGLAVALHCPQATNNVMSGMSSYVVSQIFLFLA